MAICLPSTSTVLPSPVGMSAVDATRTKFAMLPPPEGPDRARRITFSSCLIRDANGASKRMRRSEQRQLFARADDRIEIGAQEAQYRVGDRRQLMLDVVSVIGRRGELARRFRTVTRHHVGDNTTAVPGLLARRLHVRRRRLGVRLDVLTNGFLVRELIVELAGAQVGDEGADELLHRLIVKHALQK